MTAREQLALRVSAWGAITFVVLAGWLINPATTHEIQVDSEQTGTEEEARRRQGGRLVALDLISHKEDIKKPLAFVAQRRAGHSWDSGWWVSRSG